VVGGGGVGLQVPVPGTLWLAIQVDHKFRYSPLQCNRAAGHAFVLGALAVQAAHRHTIPLNVFLEFASVADAMAFVSSMWTCRAYAKASDMRVTYNKDAVDELRWLPQANWSTSRRNVVFVLDIVTLGVRKFVSAIHDGLLPDGCDDLSGFLRGVQDDDVLAQRLYDANTDQRVFVVLVNSARAVDRVPDSVGARPENALLA
jgi:hypothetical protein